MDSVLSLNCLQNSAMLIPSGPRAWPMAGPGRAAQDRTRSLTDLTRDIVVFVVVVVVVFVVVVIYVLGLG